MMSIIRFMAKSMILRAAVQPSGGKDKKINQRHTMNLNSASEYKNYPNPISNQSKEHQDVKIREMVSHVFKDLSRQMGVLEKEHKIISQQNSSNFQKINLGRQKLLEIETSNSGTMLSDVVNVLFKRGENITSFLNQIQANMNMQFKDGINVQNFSKLREQYQEEAAPRLDQAKNKLAQLFKQYLSNYEQKRRQQMINFQCQVKIQQELTSQDKSKNGNHSKRLGNEQIKTLKNRNKLLQQQNQTLKTFLKQKVQHYEKIIAELQTQNNHFETKIQTEIKITSEIFKVGKGQNEAGNEHGDKVSEIFSTKSFESQKHMRRQRQMIKRSRAPLNLTQLIKSKVKTHFDDKNLAIYKGLIDLIANYPQQVIVQQTVLQNISTNPQIQQTRVYQQKQNQPIYHQNQINRKSCEQPLQHMQNLKEIKDSLQDYTQKDRTNQIASSEMATLQNKNHTTSKQSINPPKTTKRRKINNTKSCFNINFTLAQQNISHIQKSVALQTKKDFTAYLHQPFSSNYKVLTEPNEDKIQLRASKFKKHTRVTCPTQNTKNDIEGYICDVTSKSKMITVLSRWAQTGKCKFMHKPLTFQKQDIINLFFSSDNAYNYELLNVSLVSKTSSYMTLVNDKHIAVKKVKNCPYKPNATTDHAQKQQLNFDLSSFLTNLLHKYLKAIKHTKRPTSGSNYHSLQNFLRFPFSAVNRRDEPSWKEHDRQDYNIQYWELKKYMGRIVKLHSNCKLKHPIQAIEQSNYLQNIVCQHVICFLTRLGISFPQKLP